MADTKVSDLSAHAAPLEADLLYVVTAGASKKLTLQALFPGFAKIAHLLRSTGNLTVNGTSWADLDSSLFLNVPGTAIAGDLVEVGLAGQWQNESIDGRLDAVSLVTGSPVNQWGSGAAESGTHEGVLAWAGHSGVISNAGGSLFKTLVSGDIESGALKIQFRARTLTVGNKVLKASANQPLHIWARNYGQVAT